MSRARIVQPSIEARIHLSLTLEEARALHCLTGYDLVKVLVHINTDELRGHKSSLQALVGMLRTDLGAALTKVSHAEGVINGTLEARHPIPTPVKSQD